MIWGSLAFYFIIDYFYNYVVGGQYVGSITKAMSEANFWFTTVLVVTISVMPVLAWRFYFVDVAPTLSDRVRLKQRMAAVRSRQSQDVLRTPSARRARRSIRSGYAFAHQEGFGRLITSGKIMRKLPNPDFNLPNIIGKLQNMNSNVNNSGSINNNAGNNNKQINNNSTSSGGNSSGSGGGVVVVVPSPPPPQPTSSSSLHPPQTTSGSQDSNTSSSGGRAPIQDLDTINL